jgi:hypothetical protein
LSVPANQEKNALHTAKTFLKSTNHPLIPDTILDNILIRFPKEADFLIYN